MSAVDEYSSITLPHNMAVARNRPASLPTHVDGIGYVVLVGTTSLLSTNSSSSSHLFVRLNNVSSGVMAHAEDMLEAADDDTAFSPTSHPLRDFYR